MLRKNSKGKQSTKYNFLPTRQAGHPSNTEITLFGGEDSPFVRSWRLGSMVLDGNLARVAG
jgi:hypothetical protein